MGEGEFIDLDIPDMRKSCVTNDYFTADIKNTSVASL